MAECSFTISIRPAVTTTEKGGGAIDTIIADILHPHLSGEEGNSSYQVITPNKMDTQILKTRRSQKDPVYE